jgi:CRISPR-associated helicase Cas3
VIYIHVFLNAMAGLQSAGIDVAEHDLSRLPRRMALTVNRRALVDDQFTEASALKEALQNSTDSVLQEIRRGLSLRSGLAVINASEVTESDSKSEPEDFYVLEMRGGASLSSEDRLWRYHPTACAVICATPDMFGSRLLFRGYGTSRGARPIEAGLFAYDTVLVADEAHLSQQLLKTARSIKRVESYRSNSSVSLPTPLQVVETTATPANLDSGLHEIRLDQTDFEHDKNLETRMRKQKTVVIEPPSSADKLAADIANECVLLMRKAPGSVGCIVNNVSTASAVAKDIQDALKKEPLSDSNTSEEIVLCLTGPTREYNRTEVLSRLREGTTRCVVGTQTLEVGMDVDFAAMVTELAPASSLVQRLGRLNRGGALDDATAYIYYSPDKKSTAPYEKEDLQQSLEWLKQFEGTAEGLSPWAASHSQMPATASSRMLFQRLEYWDAENLSSTDEDLATDLNVDLQNPSDLNLWLRDSLDSDDAPNIGVVVRDLPSTVNIALEYLHLTPPVASEIFPLRSYAQLQKKTWSKVKKSTERLFIYRAGAKNEDEFTAYSIDKALSSEPGELLQSGDVIILDTSAAVFDDQIHAFTPEQTQNKQEKDVFNRTAGDTLVLSGSQTRRDSDGAITHVSPLFDTLSAIEEKQLDLKNLNEELDEKINSRTSAESTGEELKLQKEYGRLNADFQEALQDICERLISEEDIKNSVLGREKNAATLIPDFLSEEVPESAEASKDGTTHTVTSQWLIIHLSSSLLETTTAQEVTLKDEKRDRVFLLGEGGHEDCVGKRVGVLARHLGMNPETIETLKEAGLHHDDGKKDLRFQDLLHYVARVPAQKKKYEQTSYWAKSGTSHRLISQEQQYRLEHGLRGWRHEQRSVAEYSRLPDGEKHALDQKLVERLIGTSHGHGRGSFRDNADTLIPITERNNETASAPQEDIENVYRNAHELFDSGEWEALITTTHERYGIWGCAYLEALLRAADVTISMEGKYAHGSVSTAR